MNNIIKIVNNPELYYPSEVDRAKMIHRFYTRSKSFQARIQRESKDTMTHDLPKDRLGFTDHSTPLSRLGIPSFRKLMVKFFAGITWVDIANTIVVVVLGYVITVGVLSI